MKKALIIMMALVLLLPSAALADKSLNFNFVGDCTLACNEDMKGYPESFMSYITNNGYEYPFKNVKALLEKDDLTIANVECVLSDVRTGKRKKTYNFRAPAEYAQILTNGSIELANLANNHTYDYGDGGLTRTKEALDAVGINYFEESNVYYYEKDGIKIAFYGLASDYFDVNKRAMRESIAEFKANGGNAVVVSIHMGSEYASIRTTRQTRSAEYAIDAGADLVIMHHAHVVLGADIYKNRYIFYGLGNFCFGGNFYLKRRTYDNERTSLESMVLGVRLDFADDGEYMGQQVTIYPAYTSSISPVNDYSPILVTGEQADSVIAYMQEDSSITLSPFDSEKGCAEQPYLLAH
ncbi:MAG: CapA family protein [Eubacteriales bacterium]|nr:CapA family protein [Eubacteriales bacterium]MDD3882788.1 CapA family protein [Eubacteriales bacterium]MDD4512942.1 CapA family protein [Eubacteriales bacterium]